MLNQPNRCTTFCRNDGGNYMKTILFILTIFTSNLVLGQNRELHIKTYEDGDTTLWYKLRTQLCHQIELDSIQNSTNNWHFRLWTNTQAIDIWESSNGLKYGKITSWTKEYAPNGEEPTNRVFYEYKFLDTEKINLLVALIDSSKIKKIPSDDLIENWNQGHDGITYIIETSYTENYFFKTYWTPTAQESIEVALIIQEFVDRFLVTTESQKVWSDFTSRIPFENYTDGSTIACRPLTNRERRKLKRERKNYRQQKLAIINI